MLSVSDAFAVLSPERYVVRAEQVIVMVPDVLLNNEMASPSANTPFGITMLPPVVI